MKITKILNIILILSITSLSIFANDNFDKQIKDMLKAKNTYPLILQDNNNKIENKKINECSGLAKSLKYKDLYWTHNDSGNSNKIYAINSKGKTCEGFSADGIIVDGAKNVDWEDMCIAPNGDLIIADLGNNYSNRKDLCLYIIQEPSFGSKKTEKARKIEVYYEDQKTFEKNRKSIYDCEAIFYFEANLYIITKRWLDQKATIYKVDFDKQIKLNSKKVPLSPLQTINTSSLVTSSATNKEQNKLAVLCYGAVFIFDLIKNKNINQDLPFSLNLSKALPITGLQIEAVEFSQDEKSLIITNEQRDIFKIEIDNL